MTTRADLSIEDRQYLDDVYDLHTAGVTAIKIGDETDRRAVHHFADRVRRDRVPARIDGPALDLHTISDEDLLALARKAVDHPEQVTLNEIRLFAEFVFLGL